MAILAECPFCHNKQSARNKICKCGAELDKLKRSKKIRYWINFRLPDVKQRREFVGNSIEKAKRNKVLVQAGNHADLFGTLHVVSAVVTGCGKPCSKSRISLNCW